MPTFDCNVHNAVLSSSLDVAFAHNKRGGYHYELRRRDVAGARYWPDGDCADYALVKFEARRIAKLSELFGFVEHVDYLIDDATGLPLGTVRWRVSSDGGATWHYHDGTAWYEADPLLDGDFGLMVDMDLNAAAYPKKDAHNFQFWARIEPDATKKFSPRVRGAAVQAEVYGLDMEEMRQSVQDFVSQNLKARLWTEEELEEETSTVKIRTRMKILSVKGAYNLGLNMESETPVPNTETPRTSIYTDGSLDEEEKTIELEGGPYPIGTRIRIEFEGRPDKDAYTSVDAEFYRAELPAILVETPSVAEAREFSNHPIQDWSPHRDEVRERWAPRRVFLRCHMKVKATRDTVADALAQALRELFDHTPCHNIQTGARMKLFSYEPYRSENSVAAAVHARAADAVLLTEIYDGPYRTFHKVKEISLATTLPHAEAPAGQVVDREVDV